MIDLQQSKVEMYSKYERQKDKRTYRDRKVIYTGPQYRYPAEKVKPTKSIVWDENTGLPMYVEGDEAPVPVANNTEAINAGGEEEEE